MSTANHNIVSLKKEKFLIFGAGNMGISVIKSLLSNKISPRNILIVEKRISPELKKLKLQNNLIIKKKINYESERYEPTITLLAVKPDQLQSSIDNDFERLTKKSIVVSIIAGKKISYLKKIFPKSIGIARAMTNTPVSLNMGTSIICFENKVSRKKRNIVINFMSLFGQVNETKSEKLIDNFTAIYGSGPAYVYLFVDSLIKISNKLGFKNSKNMTLQTLLGSVLLMLSSKHEPEELKRKVKSRGGTTEAALSILESSEGMQNLLERAIKKAAKRSVDLSKN